MGAPRQLAVVPVVLAPVEIREVPDTVVVYGSLRADEEVRIGFLVPGRLAEILVDLGSVVRRGDVLARLDTQTLQLRADEAEAAIRHARVRLELPAEGEVDDVDPEQLAIVVQAHAQLDQALQDRDRAAGLWKSDLLPLAQRDAAVSVHLVAQARLRLARNEIASLRAELVQRRAELAVARQDLAESVLKAPFDGVVSERSAGRNEIVSVGDPIVTLLRIDPLRLHLSVPERQAPQVRPGQRVRFTLEGDAEARDAVVVRLSPAIRSDNRTLEVEADVRNPDGVLRSGSFARATIEVGQPRSRITVPVASVLSFAGVDKVFLERGGKAVAVQVELGLRTPSWVEITRGIDHGAKVVLSPGDVVDGQPVAVTPATKANAASPATSAGEDTK